MNWPLKFKAAEALVVARLPQPVPEKMSAALHTIFLIGSNDGAASMFTAAKQPAVVCARWPGMHYRPAERRAMSALKLRGISPNLRAAFRLAWLAGFADGMGSVFDGLEQDPDMHLVIGRGCKVTTE